MEDLSKIASNVLEGGKQGLKKGADIKMTMDATAANVYIGISEGIVKVGEGVLDGTMALEAEIIYPVTKVVDKVIGTDNAHKTLTSVNNFIKRDLTDELYDKVYDTKIGQTLDEKSIDFLKRNEGESDASFGYKASEVVGQVGLDIGLTAIPYAGPIIASVTDGLSSAGDNIETTLNKMDEEKLDNEKDLLLADTKGVVVGTFDGILSYAIKGERQAKNVAIKAATAEKTGAKETINEIYKVTQSKQFKKHTMNIKQLEEIKTSGEALIEKTFQSDEEDIEDKYQAIMDSINNNVQAIQTR